MTKILVTGALGFIGRNLVPRLREAGHDVVGVDIESGDLSDESPWLKISPSEVVIHLAGKSFVPDSWADPVSFIKTNVMSTVGALNYCKKNNARLIFLSSYLYGNPKTLPVSETAPLSVTNPYALSKKLSEEACKFYSDSFNLRITIFRPFNVYGPGQNESFLIPSIICQIESGNAIRVRDLEPKRDYLYVDDVVQGILKSVYCQSRFSIMNLGSGESHSVEDIIRIIQQLMKTNLPVYSSQERRKDEMMDTVADIREARAQLGWAPHWTLARGLEQVLKRYRGFDE